MAELLKLLESITGRRQLTLYVQDGLFCEKRGALLVTEKLIEELRLAVRGTEQERA